MSWKYFTIDEFRCKHCGENKMQHKFIDKLDVLRRLCNFPLIISSGYRCSIHNQAVSNTGPNGPHTTGRAVDIAIDRERAYKLLKLVMNPFTSGTSVFETIPLITGIGFKQSGPSRFIHLDDLELPHFPRPNIWTY